MWNSLDKPPKRATPVLVTAETKYGPKKRRLAIGTYWTPGKGHDSDEAEWAIDGDEFDQERVIAWQPGPQIFAPDNA